MLKALKYEILRDVKAGGPAVQLAVRPIRVATIINEASFNEDQVLTHAKNVFLEDYVHDWNWDEKTVVSSVITPGWLKVQTC